MKKSRPSGKDSPVFLAWGVRSIYINPYDALHSSQEACRIVYHDSHYILLLSLVKTLHTLFPPVFSPQNRKHREACDGDKG
jgi:hypothetical protein